MDESYALEVKKRLGERFKGRYGNMRSLTISGIGLIVLNVLIYLVNRRIWGVADADQDITKIAIATVLSALVVSGTTLFLWRFFEIPTEIYKENQEEIVQYRNKWGLDKVNTDKIYLHPERESNDHRAVLRIENKESVDLEQCYGHAVKVMVGDEKHWENKTHTANSGKELLTWYIHGDKEKWTVSRDTSEFLCVAYRHDNGNIGFTHNAIANTVNENNPDASIYVEIQIDGYLNEKPIDPLYFKGFIRKNGNDIYLEPGELYEKEA